MSAFEHLKAVSDKEDYEFIKSQSLAWAKAIEEEIKSGNSPESIADWWGDEYERPKMKTRIFHAARHIKREMTDD